ncbi:hypothetical protein [Dickeya fangzhongdai]|uniref:hypothetical protein n=1 Tax=Dickeya fangzhongdai TaxID=1778540 RepID=UPI001ADAF219|nr:hypothetical protein [Dickeya fangzhongdai]MBO8134710.1 hypothetical protein [Dickeya fangzhongdai]
MSINFDVVINSPDLSIDMKSGLDTLQGVSDSSRFIAEAILGEVRENVPKKILHTSKVRTNLKKNFKGSYGQIFSIDIYDEELKKRLNKIGKSVFAEIMSYFINESLYLESEDLSDKAQKIVDGLGEKPDELVKQLRVSSLENAHEIAIKFDHEIKIRYRKSNSEQIELAQLNKKTALTFKAQESKTKEDIVASITRLNINTGNGRLLVKGSSETIAFGFLVKYKEVKLEAKKVFSKNLDTNNGLSSESWSFLRLQVQPVKLQDGKIIKYMITGIYNNE